LARPYARPTCAERAYGGDPQWRQPGNLKETIRVRHVPIRTVSVARYSCVYQNVQSSLGSTVRSL
jgi:hypothetical protein